MRETGSRPLKATGVAALALALAAAFPARAQQGSMMRLGLAASGVVQAILVADGARVEAGAVILRLDCRAIEAEIRLRQANLAAARALSDKARNGPRPVELAIGLAAVGVAQARADEAEASFRRLSQLVEGVSVTRAQLLQSRREARVTAAQLEDAQKRFELLKAGTRSEEISETEARAAAAEASLAEAGVRLDQCALRAPVAGHVRLLATLGQFVSTAAPATLAELAAEPLR